MFNEEQKTRFITGYTHSLNTANVAVTIFNATEKYELAWNADLCTKSSEELQPMFDEIAGLRAKSKWMSLTILREYVRWCITMGIPDACDGMLHIETVGLDKIRKQMVANPMHLQSYLDTMFEKESEETIDNLFRCYFWMAYGGIDEDDTILVKTEDVDFSKMIIRYKTTTVPIYREAVPAFRNAAMLTDFNYIHTQSPRYEMRRDRIPGDTIMRGIKADAKILTMRTTISKRNIKAIKEGRMELQLSFYRVRMSGLFYRVYEMERADVPENPQSKSANFSADARRNIFSEAVRRTMSGKSYVLSGRETIEHKHNRLLKDYMEDYERWKLAFSMQK